MTQDQPPQDQTTERDEACATTSDAAQQRVHSVYKPTKWAMSVPTLQRADGRPDTVAHHVLLVMATYANPDGTSIRASVATLTRKSHLTTQKAVTEALKRLKAAKLIIRTGILTGGTVVWKLNFEIEGDDLYEERAAQRRAANAERQRRRRQRLAEPERHGLPERDVTAYQPVTHGLPERESRADERDNRRSPRLHQPLDQPVTSPHGPKDGGTLPPDPLRTEAPPTSAPRTDLEPEPDSSKTPPTELDLSTQVPPAREETPPNSDEPSPQELVRRLYDLQRTKPDTYNAIRAKARAALGEPITDFNALDRETYRLSQMEVTSDAAS